MANPFLVNGAASEKQSKFAPLLVSRFWTGQYSNSNPLNEAAVPLLYQRFYSGSRYEQIRYGQNVEISPRLTIIRRPGVSVYNSASFPACTTYYSFRVFNTETLQPQIRVIADTATAVYDATGPNTQTLLYTKLAGAGQTSFQSVGNTLYAADGVGRWKWVWQPGWIANTNYTTGTAILDPNGNLQVLTGVVTGFANPSVTISNNIALVTWSGSLWTNSQLSTLPGSQATASGFVGASFLNGQTVTLTTVYNYPNLPHTPHTAALSFSFSHANYGPTADVGTFALTSGNGTSGNSTPSWSTTIGATTADSTLVWTCKGPAVEDWGIVAPLYAPTVSNVLLPLGTAWATSSYYWPNNNAIILDSNGNIQQLTTSGTTSTVPAWSSTPGVTTNDGTAVWTCRGSATRGTMTAYALGSWIAVTVTTVIVVGNAPRSIHTVTVTNKYFFSCFAAGTTSSTATASLSWPSALGSTITDGTVTWANAGYQVTRTASATSSPTSNTAGNVSNTVAVTNNGSIVDSAGSGGGSGFTQNVHLAGISGASPPTWKTTGSPAVEAPGLITTEAGGLQWLNAGQISAANTGTWVYGYSFANSVTGHESTMSPLSSPIILAAVSGIAIGGQGDPNWQTDGVDTINIYRSTQGFTTPFRLIQIPAPASGTQWSYIDSSPDPPNPAAILNEFIQADQVGKNAPPSSGLTNLTYYLNRIFGSNGVFQEYSGVASQPVGVGAESWGASNFAQMPEVIVRSWPSASGLLMFTAHGVFFSQGIDSNGNPNTPIQILEDIGLLSTNLFTVNGSIPVILTSDRQMLALDPSSGITRYSDPIADSANGMGGFSTTASYLTWYVNGTDSAFYLADGSTGWFRLSPTAAPESGFTWSPKAGIVGGCGAIGAIETIPGVKKLLISPPAGGQIFQRDLTTNADNGTAYPANFVIGSIVLAQPNQCAEIRSISTYCNAIGSRIQVGFLGDEIAPSTQVPFAILQQSTSEPDFLNPPLSVFADRWYADQAGAPVWLQHMQLQFTWPTENFQNELLGFAIYGAVHIEG